MDTFARDPTLDWQATARKKAKAPPGASTPAAAAAGPEPSSDADTGAAASGGAEVWLPRARVLTARLKLSRVNPAAIMALDVLQNAMYAPTGAARAQPARYEALLGAVRAAIAGTAWPLPPPGKSRPPAAAVAASAPSSVRTRARPENNIAAALPPWQQALLEAALGGPLVGNASASLDAAITLCPDIAAQVDCLFDLATDPNILARQWFGLATWC